ncbi:hypothetical protein SALBM135S_05510 [Streptomyces alboniger]
MPAAEAGAAGAPRRTTPVSSRSASCAASGVRPADWSSAPSGPYRAARPPSLAASLRRTAGTGSGSAAAVARPCCACATRRSSAWRASAMSRHTARATPLNVVRGGTSTSGSPWRSQAATRAGGTVSWTGATPKPRAAPPAATMRDT